MIDFKVGAPYSFRNYNCWDYCVDIRNAAGFKTKEFKVKTLRAGFSEIAKQMNEIEHGLLLVTEKENFDIVMVKRCESYHCGLFYDGDVIHCSGHLKQVVKQSFNSFIESYESFTLWR